MGNTYILYNPLSGNGTGYSEAQILWFVVDDSEIVDITTIEDYTDYISRLQPDDSIILCGGDGTLNRFANSIRGLHTDNDIFYYAAGSGNDFTRDVGAPTGAVPLIRINEYLSALPTVSVNGEEYVFINGIGYGIDGYCCEVGEQHRKTTSKPVNYTSIAVKGLLFHYKPTNAVVTVDGIRHTYKKVWLAPTMNGRYYGGGMMPAPEQSRTDSSGTLSVMVFHGAGKLKTLCIFPSIFKGTHIKHRKYVEVLTGHDITVEFDRPAPLQIDGEVVRNVTRYRAVKQPTVQK